MNQYILEIESILKQFPQRTSAHNPEAYIGGGQSRLRYLGLRIPHLNQAMKKGFSFSNETNDKIAKIWDYIWWNSDCFEIMALALFWFYDKKQKSNLVDYWPILSKWSNKIDNWAHSDTLSGLYARILEQNPTRAYPTFVKWGGSKNPWLRRLSIVSLIYYSSQREKILPFVKIIKLVDKQLEYDHYYVQKGVGWTLRETYNVYPVKTFEYVKKNIHKISAQAFSATTEKMSVKQKLILKNLRKNKS